MHSRPGVGFPLSSCSVLTVAQILLTAAVSHLLLSLSLSADVLTLTVLVTVTALPSTAHACVKRSVFQSVSQGMREERVSFFRHIGLKLPLSNDCAGRYNR